ncbi:motility associated factor glycosyltransferase family protein [Clostridium ganghwense]|uniref:DUF115 domain-containing protein n=1 Tax=Clostridium ganghwense TaxID=312089 RepID=A0ABT4CMY7_9CLOT|nr:6-hydroxymethylpterin diphosphokinase MptE-like protein [Clostridium ganghwense]MCY6370414.1 DUF115 domain-containing protein [Clostridium ganghwense]
MLNNNLNILKEYYSELYKEILNHDEKKLPKIVESKNGMPNLMLNSGEWIHSTYNPEKEAVRWIEGFDVEDQDTILVIGLGLGYYLDNLIEKYSNKKLIIIEPNLEIFIKLLEVNDIGDYLKSENIVFIVGKEAYIVRRLISEYFSQNKIKRVYTAEMSIYRKINEEYIEELYEEIHKGLSMLMGNIATEAAFAQMWLNNAIRNFEYIKDIPNVSVTKDKFKDIPVVIVSAGPSLDKNVHYLKTIYNKALIIAVGSAVNILEKKGITPHIIMGLDGQEMEAKLFQNLKNHKSIFVYGASVHYKAVQDYKGLKMCLVLKSDLTMIELYKKLGIDIDTFSTGPSVSNVALVLAHYLQASNILIIGQDLAYTNDNRYAEGGILNYNIEKKEVEKKSNYVKRKDIYGNDVYTKTDLIGIKNWFEDYVKIFEDEITVYNCTEGGLGIKGVPNMSFKEAIEKFCIKEFDIYEELVSLAKEKSCIDVDRYNDLLSKYKEETDKCIELSKKRLKQIYKLLDEYKSDDFQVKLVKLLSISEKIEEFELFEIFIYPTGRCYIDAITSAVNNKLEKLNNINEKNKVLLDGLTYQYEYIDECLQIVKLALEKEDIPYIS